MTNDLSIFCHDDLSKIPFLESQSARLIFDGKEIYHHDGVKMRFYKIGNFGYTLSVYDNEGNNLADFVFNKDQIANLVVQSEMVQVP